MLDGRCALVTGSVAGLGYTIAESLARAGANVVMNGLCDLAEGRSASERLSAATGSEAVFCGADLRRVSEIERMFDEAAARFGKVDIVVNNAVVRHFSPIDKLSTEDWEAALAVNVSEHVCSANGIGRVFAHADLAAQAKHLAICNSEITEVLHSGFTG